MSTILTGLGHGGSFILHSYYYYLIIFRIYLNQSLKLFPAENNSTNNCPTVPTPTYIEPSTLKTWAGCTPPKYSIYIFKK